MPKPSDIFTSFEPSGTQQWLDLIADSLPESGGTWEAAAGIRVDCAFPLASSLALPPVSEHPGWQWVEPGLFDESSLASVNSETPLLWFDTGEGPVTDPGPDAVVFPSISRSARLEDWFRADVRTNAVLIDPVVARLYGANIPESRPAPFFVDLFSMDTTGMGAITGIALALYSLNRQLARLPGHRGQSVRLLVPVRTEFLSEAAKLRALRVCASHLLSLWNVSDPPVVHAITSPLAHHPKDADTNLIRGTIQGAAAVVGCADVVTLLPHDLHSGGLINPSSVELARNTMRILAHESFLSVMADPLAGSGAVEHVTDRFVEAAWDRFLLMAELEDPVLLLDDTFLPTWIRADREHYLRAGRRRGGEGLRTVVGVTSFVDKSGFVEEPGSVDDSGANGPAGAGSSQFAFPFPAGFVGPCPELEPWMPFE